MEKIKKILEENKSLKILAPLLLIAVVVVVIMYLPKGSSPSNTQTSINPTDPPTSTSDLGDQNALPTSFPQDTQTDYSSQNSNNEGNDASLIGPPIYKGQMTDESGTIVEIQFTNVSKYIKLNESISGYKLKSIAADSSSIVLEKSGILTVLQLSSNSN
ncbi:MAG: hypothetical protein WCQ41_05920 [Bacillota bacterium]